MKRLIRDTVIWLTAGMILTCGAAAFGLVDLARTSSGDYPDRLFAIEEERAEFMGEEVSLPELPPQTSKIVSAATGLIPPEWKLLFKTVLKSLQEGFAANSDAETETAPASEFAFFPGPALFILA